MYVPSINTHYTMDLMH